MQTEMDILRLAWLSERSSETLRKTDTDDSVQYLYKLYLESYREAQRIIFMVNV